MPPPAVHAAAPERSDKINVPELPLVCVTDTVYRDDEFAVTPVIAHPVDVPDREKSSALIPVTASSNCTVKEVLVEFVRDEAGEIVAVGRVSNVADA